MSRRPETQVRAAGAVLGLRCRDCGFDVYPCPSGDTFQFYCRAGHPTALRDAASLPDDAVRAALGLMLRSWESTLQDLEHSAAEAARCGLFDVASIYQRQVGPLKDRIETVRAAIWAASPSQTA